MKYLLFGVFIFGLAFTPVYVLDSMVMPELQSMKNFYGGMDTVAEDIAAGKEYASNKQFKEFEQTQLQLHAKLDQQ